MPGLAGVVTAQASQLAAERPALQRRHHPRRARIAAPFLREHQIESLLGERHEIQSVRDRGAARHHPGVRGPHRYSLRNLKVAAEQPVIALDGGARHPGLAQQAVEETARPSPRLAVDETYAGPR